MAHLTSSAEVRQLQTLIRMARRPRHVVPKKNAFWSQVEVSQSAPSAEGKLPPITHAKERPPALPT
jgi:hypothetical protein